MDLITSQRDDNCGTFVSFTSTLIYDRMIEESYRQLDYKDSIIPENSYVNTIK